MNIMVRDRGFLFHRFNTGPLKGQYAIIGPIYKEGGTTWYFVAPPGKNREQAEKLLRKKAETYLSGG